MDAASILKTAKRLKKKRRFCLLDFDMKIIIRELILGYFRIMQIFLLIGYIEIW